MSTNKNTEPTLSSAQHYQDDHFEQEVIIRSKIAYLFEFWQLWAQMKCHEICTIYIYLNRKKMFIHCQSLRLKLHVPSQFLTGLSSILSFISYLHVSTWSRTYSLIRPGHTLGPNLPRHHSSNIWVWPAGDALVNIFKFTFMDATASQEVSIAAPVFCCTTFLTNFLWEGW